MKFTSSGSITAYLPLLSRSCSEPNTHHQSTLRVEQKAQILKRPHICSETSTQRKSTLTAVSIHPCQA